ncbi:hypothetical protein L1887_43992 [Cichorium endivia]|nr:hypothetical protein L1887_43992 [Cichorium endivia]
MVEVLGRNVGVESVVGRVDLTDGLLERLLKGAADGHDLADRLHAGADLAVDVLELAEVPLGDLGDDVVQRGLEARRGGLGHGVGQLGERVAERELGGGVGERIAGGLGGERRRARQTRIHLDHAVLAAVRAEGVLDVALADDAEVADDLEGGGAQHVVVVVRHGLGGSDDDRVARVDAERVEVLHVAADDGIVLLVAQHLVLGLLPALERLFDEDLGAEGEGAGGEVAQLVLVVGEAGAETAERVGGTHDDGVADLGGGLKRLDGLDAGLAERLDGLGSGVVELAGLTDGETAGADEEDLLDVGALHLGEVLAPLLQAGCGGLDVFDGGLGGGGGRRFLEQGGCGESRTEDLGARSCEAGAVQRGGCGLVVKAASDAGQLEVGGGSDLRGGRVGASRQGSHASIHGVERTTRGACHHRLRVRSAILSSIPVRRLCDTGEQGAGSSELDAKYGGSRRGSVRTTAARVCCVADLRGSCHDGSWRMDGGGKDSKSKAGLISGRRFWAKTRLSLSLPLTRIPSQRRQREARKKKVHAAAEAKKKKKKNPSVCCCRCCCRCLCFCSGFLSGRRRSAPRSPLSPPSSAPCIDAGPATVSVALSHVHSSARCHGHVKQRKEDRSDPRWCGCRRPKLVRSITLGSVPRLSAPEMLLADWLRFRCLALRLQRLEADPRAPTLIARCGPALGPTDSIVNDVGESCSRCAEGSTSLQLASFCSDGFSAVGLLDAQSLDTLRPSPRSNANFAIGDRRHCKTWICSHVIVGGVIAAGFARTGDECKARWSRARLALDLHESDPCATISPGSGVQHLFERCPECRTEGQRCGGWMWIKVAPDADPKLAKSGDDRTQSLTHSNEQQPLPHSCIPHRQLSSSSAPRRAKMLCVAPAMIKVLSVAGRGGKAGERFPHLSAPRPALKAPAPLRSGPQPELKAIR